MTTSTAASPELAPRLAYLFASAGLIRQDDLKAFQTRSRKYKPIVEVLNQEAFSLGTFRDLFFKAEINPFKLWNNNHSLGGQLARTADLQSDDLAEIVTRHPRALDRLIAALDEAGAPEVKTLREGMKQARHLKEEPGRWFIRNSLLDSENLQRFLSLPRNPLVSLSALFLAMSVLEYNGLVDPEAFATWLKKMDGSEGTLKESLGEILTQARRIIKLSSKELIGKIEAGLNLQEVAPDRVSRDPSVIELFPKEFFRRGMFLPLFQDTHQIGVAVADPLDLGLAVLVRWITGKWMRPYFCPSGTLVDLIQDFAFPDDSAISQGNGAGMAAVPKVASERASAKSPRNKVADKSVLQNQPSSPTPREANAEIIPKSKVPPAPTDTPSAVQLVSSLLERAIELQATDIHLEPRHKQMTVRFRLDGMLTKILNIPPNLVGPVVSRIKVLANMDVTERRRPQDGHIALNIAQRHFDFRVATLPSAYGEKTAIRILDSARLMNGMTEIGMDPRQLKIAHRLIGKPYGIILVTGPTGSGKTSTLYAALNELNDERRHLVTIEDPIEYQLEGINQVQVEPNIGLTFSEGLRAILRQDPDIIMVGEIRDPDTALTAVRAAVTGHLVFSTLHTNTAMGAFQALANLGASPYMIGSGIAGVISQRLVRKLCPKCKRLAPVSKAMAEQLGVKNGGKLRWHRAVGCPECLGAGYKGRIGIFEVIEMTENLQRAVLANESPSRLLQMADEDGRISIREAGLEKVRAGLTSPEELIEKVMLND